MRDKPLLISAVLASVIYLIFLIILFTPLRNVLAPFITSLMLVYLLNPLVKLLEKLKIKSSIAVFLVYMGILCVGAFIVLFALPKIYTAILKIADLLSGYIGGAMRERIEGSIVAGGVGRLYTTVVSATKVTVSTFVGFVAAFYILCDRKGVKNAFKEFIPLKLMAPVRVICDDVKSSFDSFFKGQLLIAVILFVIDAVFLYMMKVPYSLGLAFIAAILDIVPYAGAIIAMGIISIVTLLSAPGKIFVVVIGLLIIQQIENHIITPKVSSENLKLHPAITVLALYLGAYGGFWGILLAIPLVCVFKKLFLRVIQSIL